MTARKILHRADPTKTAAFRRAVKDMRAAAAEPKIGDAMPDGSIFAGISPDTGRKMFVAPEDSLCSSFNNVARKVAQMNAQPYLGHADWRIPSKAELQVLYDNRNVGALAGTFDDSGSFTRGWYYSSTQATGASAFWQQRFNDGAQNYFHESASASLRCLRG